MSVFNLKTAALGVRCRRRPQRLRLRPVRRRWRRCRLRQRLWLLRPLLQRAVTATAAAIMAPATVATAIRYGGYGGYGYGSPYYGWNDGFYYPGTGYYVYDRDRRPHRWTRRAAPLLGARGVASQRRRGGDVCESSRTGLTSRTPDATTGTVVRQRSVATSTGINHDVHASRQSERQRVQTRDRTSPGAARTARTEVSRSVAGIAAAATGTSTTTSGERRSGASRPLTAVASALVRAAPDQHDRGEAHHRDVVLVGDDRLRAEGADVAASIATDVFSTILPRTCSVSPG